ncbi:unnamed protein product, partial [Symbiodinium necroappetens]
VQEQEDPVASETEGLNSAVPGGEPFLSPEAIGLLGDAVTDSVMSVGRSTVEIALPWEASGMNLIFREEDPVDVMLNSLPASIPVPAPPVQPEELVKEPPMKRARPFPESGECFRGAISLQGYDNDEDKVEGVWRRALEKWLVVVTACPGTSLIGDRVSKMAATEAAETLRELFGRKSAATVLKRGSALEAVNFAIHVVGVSMLVASKGKAERRQATVLSVHQVAALEYMLQDVAEEVGLSFSGDRKGPVLPAPDQRGGWTKRSVDAGEVTKWLHALLARSGNEASPGTTSHTVKSTVLSWCAKYGMARHPRLQLGHHTSGDGSLDTYGRDTLAPALLQLTSMLESIRRGTFLPDLTRSGRFRKRTSIKVESSDEEAE